VKLYRGGRLDDDLFRTIIANSRAPEAVRGDLLALVAAARIGIGELCQAVERHDLQRFDACVERMYDDGEAVVRSYISGIADGLYASHGTLDGDGRDSGELHFDVKLEVMGSDVLIDLTAAPEQRPAPVNCPLPATVSSVRLAVLSLTAPREALNEGHLRPIKIRTHEGTIFDPHPPAPIMCYAWTAYQVTDAVQRAFADGQPGLFPAGSGNDPCAVMFWGRRTSGRLWATGTGYRLTGQGASADADGANAQTCLALAGMRVSSVEVVEARYPLRVEKAELAPDSGGAGRFRGGLGINVELRVLDDCLSTATLERTKSPPWPIAGGKPGRTNSLTMHAPGHAGRTRTKDTAVPVPAGTLIKIQTGGGGGFGPPADRDVALVAADLRHGFVTEAHARQEYPHAFPAKPGSGDDRPAAGSSCD
jgi:N-methylhydantoinase B